MENKRAERRRFIRFSLDANIKFRCFDNIDEFMKGKTKNISAEGLCIVTEKEIPIEKNIEIDISLPGKKQPVRVHGKTVWTQKIKSVDKRLFDRYEAGIRLYALDKGDENTLLKFYCERLVDNLSKYLHF